MKLTVVLVDNHGFGSIGGALALARLGRLRHRVPLRGDDGQLAATRCGRPRRQRRSLGARGVRVGTIAELRAALARGARAPTARRVIVVECDPPAASAGYESWWDVPVAEVSTMPAVQQARADYDARARARAPAAGRRRVADRRLRIGVVGAGMIAQVEHIPNLLALRDLFELVGSPTRRGTSARRSRRATACPVHATPTRCWPSPRRPAGGGARPASRRRPSWPASTRACTCSARSRSASPTREAARSPPRRDRARPGRPGRLHEALRPQLRGRARTCCRRAARPALHLRRGHRSGLLAVRRPPAAGAAGRRARRPDRRRSRPPARPGRRGAGRGRRRRPPAGVHRAAHVRARCTS